MKTVNEWVHTYINTPRCTVAMLVEEVQKESYNQAIDDLIADDAVTDKEKIIEKFKKR